MAADDQNQTGEEDPATPSPEARPSSSRGPAPWDEALEMASGGSGLLDEASGTLDGDDEEGWQEAIPADVPDDPDGDLEREPRGDLEDSTAAEAEAEEADFDEDDGYTIEALGIQIEYGIYRFKTIDVDLGPGAELIQDPRIRSVSPDRGHENHTGTFSVKEFIDLARKAMESRLQPASNDDEPSPRTLRVVSQRFEYMKATLRRSSFVLVHVYRW